MPNKSAMVPARGARAAMFDSTRLKTVHYLLAVAVALLIPLVLIAGLWLRSEFGRIEDGMVNTLATRASGLSQNIDIEVSRQLTVLQAMATLPSLDEPDLQAFNASASRMIAAVPDWIFIAVIDPVTGRELANTQSGPGAAEGAVAPGTRETAQQVVATRRPAVETQDGRPGQALRDLVVMLHVPVIRENRGPLVLSAGVKRSFIQDVLSPTVNPGLLAVVLDEQGRILARSSKLADFAGQQANESLRTQIDGHASGLFTAQTADGSEVFTAFRRSPDTGWVSVVATDSDQIDRMSESLTWSPLATSALSLALAATLAAFLYYHLVQRRLARDRLAASNALSALDARLLATTQEALDEQRKSAKEREVLLREIYHRVKNNLQIIQSLLRLGSRHLAPAQREPFESAIRRVGAMARVHTLLYNSPELDTIELRDYLDEIGAEIANASSAGERGIALRVESEPMRVPLDIAVPLAFIAVELLTNAFKHAFPPGRRGTITVTARREGENGVLVIADDGIGFEPAPGDRRALGLTIVSKLVQQINGALERVGGTGTAYKVTFSLKPASPARIPEPEMAVAP